MWKLGLRASVLAMHNQIHVSPKYCHNLNTAVGLDDMKMTVQTPPHHPPPTTESQYQPTSPDERLLPAI